MGIICHIIFNLPGNFVEIVLVS